MVALGSHLYLRFSPAKDESKIKKSLKSVLPKAETFSVKSGRPPAYEGYGVSKQGDKELRGLAFLTTDVAREVKGYAGQIKTLVGMSPKGSVTGIEIISHHETPSYVFGIHEPWFKDQFKGKQASDPFVLDKDLDGITHATVTVTAIAKGVKKGLLRVGKQRLGLPLEEAAENPWAALKPWPLVWAAAVIALALASLFTKQMLIRYGCLASTILVIGFGYPNAISVVNLVNIITCRLPSLHLNLFWYILIGFTLIGALIWGRVYCGFLCPFGAIQEFLEKLPLQIPKLKISPTAEKRARLGRNLLLWLIVLAALGLNNANIGDYEPFSTLFTWSGEHLDWLWVGLTLGGALFLPRFFCRCLCGVGVALGWLSWRSPKRLRVKPDCKGCGRCQPACPYGAIDGNSQQGYSINPVECTQCNLCLDSCPHGCLGR